ncbi:SRPBCC family protein [Streptomyces mexicanus]|uniref:SRPBCC family protein n=1 Tax=Streptomyces mexicanus TaxID=178566 RepID=A0A7X1I8F6_9ACTN|nr:SRPBCC family protein [Streptomyces mexicanus]MBC2868483.1 SRPBCC family protein [Streptomyces mexicanus]
MELRHEFTVPVPVDDAWRALLDIERVAPCLPGATVEEFDGKTVTGSVKVKLGPITVSYKGTAVFEEQDEAAHRLVLAASGRETRGQGTARATVTGTLTERDGGTAVSVLTDLTVTGRPAQFGRGVLAEVGDRLVGQFADCLAERLAGPAARAPQDSGAADEPAPPVRPEATAGHEARPSAGPGPSGSSVPPASSVSPASSASSAGEGGERIAGLPRERREEAEALDLLRVVGVPVAKRAAVGVGAVAVVALLVVSVRRLWRR